MKTLAQESCRNEIHRRLRSVRPDSARRWGKMSPHQMICHLCDGYRMATGERPVSPATGPLERTLWKWVALYLPAPWPSGIMTRPEIDQRCTGTSPIDFDTDVAQLEALLDLVATRDPRSNWPEHPIFGRLSGKAWLRWAYLHADHHLRQFGA